VPLPSEAIDEILADKGWLTVEQVAAELARRGLVDEAYHRAAVHRLLKVDLRRVLRGARDADGNPIHLYKQEEMFDLADYEYVIANHSSAARHHLEMARRYQKRCEARFGIRIQLPLPLPLEEGVPA